MTDKTASRNIQELHGSLKHVHCLSKGHYNDQGLNHATLADQSVSSSNIECGASLDRDEVQEELSRLNPEWWEYLHDNIRNGVREIILCGSLPGLT